MLLNLVRNSRTTDPSGDVAVEGVMNVVPAFPEDGEALALFTLERAAVMIPAATYTVTLTTSERAIKGELWTPLADKRLPELQHVPGRSGIRIHALNEAKQSQGCIGVGRAHTATRITDSRLALTDLCHRLVAAETRHEDVQMEITDAVTTLVE